MTLRSAYWYPLNDWVVGDGPPDQQAVDDIVLRAQTMGVTDLVLGIDGRKLNATWDYLDTFDAQSFRADLDAALDLLFTSGYQGTVSLMPVNGLYNWQTDDHARTYWAVNATLRFIEDSPYRDRITGLVTDTEFGPTPEWQQADNAGKSEILRQYTELLSGINDRVKAFDPTLLTTTYHGSHIDKGDDRYLLDGVNFADSATYAGIVDRIILPIRLTDAIDPEADHDFDALISRAISQSADELAHLSGTGTTILLDFEWEEAQRDMGAPNYFQQIEAAITDAVRSHPAFAGFAVWISTGSDVPLTDLSITGDDAANALTGTSGADIIDGLDGGDSLEGRDGDDRLLGQSGADTLRGGDGDDRLDAGAGFDLAYGGNGADKLWGRFGADTLIGGNGKDRLYGQDGHDDLRGGAGADWIVGGKHDDRLDGGFGNDSLFGNAGADTLEGGPGNDLMTGGPGPDVFVFADAQIGSDTVTDFTPGTDLLVFRDDFAEIASFADFMAATYSDAGALVYDFGDDGENVITLQGVAASALTAGDLAFL